MSPPGRFRFLKENSGLQDLAKQKTAKMWLEVAIDFMRVDQRGPACKMCKDYYYYLNTGEVATEPHKSPKYPHESFKVQIWSTCTQILGAKMRSEPRGIVSFTVGKLMVP